MTDPPRAAHPTKASRVLITGAAGNVGSQVRRRLSRPGRALRLLDLVEQTPAGEDEDVELIRGSVTDLALLERACEHVDAVIHLAGHSHEASWEEVIEVNIGGTYAVFEAARRQRVPRVIFASSAHAVGYAPLDDANTSDVLYPRPDTHYGVSKVAGEAIGSLYADRYGMDVICLRIGVCFGAPGLPEFLGGWLSPDDCARLLEASLIAPSPGYRIVWGVSANTRRTLSLAGAGQLGYEPQDDSEVFAEDVFAGHGPPAPDDPGPHRIGGSWCGPEFDTARQEHERDRHRRHRSHEDSRVPPVPR